MNYLGNVKEDLSNYGISKKSAGTTIMTDCSSFPITGNGEN